MKIFVNGSFDILHPGHMKLLSYANNLGNQLLVAIDSDRRTTERKGPSRPINNQEFRKIMLKHIKGVDEVVIFDTELELINIIKKYDPDVMIVGSDYRNERVIGSEYAKRIIFFERDQKFSTTKIIESISCR